MKKAHAISRYGQIKTSEVLNQPVPEQTQEFTAARFYEDGNYFMPEIEEDDFLMGKRPDNASFTWEEEE